MVCSTSHGKTLESSDAGADGMCCGPILPGRAFLNVRLDKVAPRDLVPERCSYAFRPLVLLRSQGTPLEWYSLRRARIGFAQCGLGGIKHLLVFVDAHCADPRRQQRFCVGLVLQPGRAIATGHTADLYRCFEQCHHVLTWKPSSSRCAFLCRATGPSAVVFVIIAFAAVRAFARSQPRRSTANFSV